MLIIYDINKNISFATSDDDYVKNYIEKWKKIPFLKYGVGYLWLKDAPFPKENLDTFKVDMVNNKLIKKSTTEIKEIEKGRKIKQRIMIVKNVEFETMQTN